MDLFEAAKAGYVVAVREWIEDGGDVNVANRASGYTLLHTAARYGSLELVDLLLSHGASVNVNARNLVNETPLHNAVLYQKRDIVDRLLAGNADPTLVDMCKWSALHYAAYNGDESLVELFLGLGVDINAADYRGRTPLYLAVMQRYHDVIEFLLECGANPNVRDEDGRRIEDISDAATKATFQAHWVRVATATLARTSIPEPLVDYICTFL